MLDVIVVGAGPAGCMAAKGCAERGLETLLLEKRRLPRDKVCSGMIMGPTARGLMEEEFGPLPDSVLSRPGSLKGYLFHVPGVGSQNLDHFTPLTWRRNLDRWMGREAQAKGVVVWEGARVSGIVQEGKGYRVKVERGGESREMEARFLVGADGATSRVRRFLFPNLRVRFGQVYQACYRGKVALDRDYFHWFYPREFSPAFFTMHWKDDLVVMDFTGVATTARPLRRWAEEFLAKGYDFHGSREPVWHGGCVEPILYRALLDRTFVPTKGNVLLAGDAAGLLLPVSGEGIGAAVRSGLAAAEAIDEATRKGTQAAQSYLKRIEGVIAFFGELLPWFKKIREETQAGGRSLPQLLADAYADTLRPLP